MSPPLPPPIPPELVRKYDRPGPRYTSYPTVPVWSHDFGETAWREALQRANARAGAPLAIYVHLPFCHHRCLFCACNVVIGRKEWVVEEYLARLEKEIAIAAPLLDRRRTVTGIHWGGGTPTHLTPEQLRRVWKALTAHFEPSRDAEISVEVHPPVTTREQMETLRELGFNRVSLGVQDMDAGVQELIERWQTVEETERLTSWARELGFHSVNYDLIYGLPGQTPETWEFTLQETLRLRPDRLAIYSYAKVPWLKPHQKRMAEELLPDPTTKIGLFRTARERLTDAGYVEIGMDHFALPQDELARAVHDRRLYRSFMGYTVRPARDYVGFGLSAISEVGDAFVQNHGKLPRWNEAIDAGRIPVDRGHRLSHDDRVRKLIIERLMCNLYLDLEEVEQLSGRPFREEFASQWEDLGEMEADGLVIRHDRAIEVTSLGRTLVRNVAMLFDAYLDPEAKKPIFSRTV